MREGEKELLHLFMKRRDRYSREREGWGRMGGWGREGTEKMKGKWKGRGRGRKGQGKGRERECEGK